MNRVETESVKAIAEQYGAEGDRLVLALYLMASDAESARQSHLGAAKRCAELMTRAVEDAERDRVTDPTSWSCFRDVAIYAERADALGQAFRTMRGEVVAILAARKAGGS